MAVENSGHRARQEDRGSVFADNQNKPTSASHCAALIDNENVDVIVDGGSSAVRMAIQPVTRDTNRLFLISGSGTHALTNQNCSPTDSSVVGHLRGRGRAPRPSLMKQKLDTWFLHTADYPRPSASGAGDRGG